MTRGIFALVVPALTPIALRAQPTSSPDSLPAHYALVLEQGPIRILEFAGAPGDKTPMHSHPPHFAYVIKGGLVRFTYPNGQAVEAPLKTGQRLRITRPLTHSIEVASTDSVSVLLVEYRASDSATTEKRSAERPRAGSRDAFGADREPEDAEPQAF